MDKKYGYVKVKVFDDTNGVDSCVSCKTFNGAWIYCPIFNKIICYGNIKFDETGEKNRSHVKYPLLYEQSGTTAWGIPFDSSYVDDIFNSKIILTKFFPNSL